MEPRQAGKPQRTVDRLAALRRIQTESDRGETGIAGPACVRIPGSAVQLAIERAEALVRTEFRRTLHVEKPQP